MVSFLSSQIPFGGIKNALQKSLVAITTLLASALPFQAKAQVGVDVVIDLPSIAILNYVSEVTVTIPAAAFGTLIGGTAAGDGFALAEGALSADASADGSGLQADLSMAITRPNLDFRSLNLVLKNAWAVRAIHKGDVEVRAVLGKGNLLENGSSKITVTDAKNPDKPFPAPGLRTPKYGDVQMTLDLSNATAPGTHKASAPTYTLEVKLL